MNASRNTACMLTAIALYALIAPFAIAGCLGALKPVSVTSKLTFRPLPAQCQALGPLRLGISRADIIAALGSPDAEIGPYHAHLIVYIFPRNLERNLQLHPETQDYFYAHYAELDLTTSYGKLVTIQVSGGPDARFPFDVGGIRLGTKINPKEIRGLYYSWNTTHDEINFLPYPLSIGTVAHKGVISDFRISQFKMPPFVPGPGLRFLTDPATHLIGGFELVFPQN